DDIGLSEKHQLLFVCDLVAIFGPCPTEHVEYYLNTLVGNNCGARAQFLLALARALRLVAQTASGHYFRPLDGALLKSFHKTPKYVDIVSLRAKAISSLQTFAEGRAALTELEAA